MSDYDATTPLPQPGEHHRHESPPPAGNPYKVLFIILAIVLGLALIALLIWLIFLRGGGPGPTPTPTPTPTQTTPSPTPTPTPTQTVAPPQTGPCTTDNSSVKLGTPDGAAGSTAVSIIFTNTSNASCTLEGFPTVEFVGDGNGTTIGEPAVEDTTTAPTLVTLAPGGLAQALLTITTAGNVCEPVDVDGFRVIPPGSNDAFFIAETDYSACDEPNTELLKVRAVAPV